MLTARQASQSTTTGCPSNLHPFDEFLRGKGLTRTTGFRYRRAGIIKTVNIFGRLYITAQEVREFEERAVRGEYSKKPNTPLRANKEQEGR